MELSNIILRMHGRNVLNQAGNHSRLVLALSQRTLKLLVDVALEFEVALQRPEALISFAAGVTNELLGRLQLGLKRPIESGQFSQTRKLGVIKPTKPCLVKVFVFIRRGAFVQRRNAHRLNQLLQIGHVRDLSDSSFFGCTIVVLFGVLCA